MGQVTCSFNSHMCCVRACSDIPSGLRAMPSLDTLHGISGPFAVPVSEPSAFVVMLVPFPLVALASLCLSIDAGRRVGSRCIVVAGPS